MIQTLIAYSPTPLLSIDKQLFYNHLIQWYKTNKRDLPWRNTKDPYKIWLSEIILQQTRVAQGIPYYQRFIEQYPTIGDLAKAKEESVLRLWQGLGYYTRARNLHACARMVVDELQEKFPENYRELLRLRGIGPYTAAAIASIAFQEAVPVLDGNVYRVLARIFGLEANRASILGKKQFHSLATSLMPSQKPGEYNQAIMEFGAIHCTPHKPLCNTCIFKAYCIAFQTNKQKQLPVKNLLVKIKKRFFHYLVIKKDNQVYMRLRKKADIWQGLYDFYLIEDTQLRELEDLQDDLITLIKHHELPITKDPKCYQHTLTHRKLYAHFFHIQATPSFIQAANKLFSQRDTQIFDLETTKGLPKPILISTFLDKEVYS